ncbi:MAG: hypothetical protein PVG14_04320 [Anaerolineales bacterium]
MQGYPTAVRPTAAVDEDTIARVVGCSGVIAPEAVEGGLKTSIAWGRGRIVNKPDHLIDDDEHQSRVLIAVAVLDGVAKAINPFKARRRIVGETSIAGKDHITAIDAGGVKAGNRQHRRSAVRIVIVGQHAAARRHSDADVTDGGVAVVTGNGCRARRTWVQSGVGIDGIHEMDIGGIRHAAVGEDGCVTDRITGIGLVIFIYVNHQNILLSGCKHRDTTRHLHTIDQLNGCQQQDYEWRNPQ